MWSKSLWCWWFSNKLGFNKSMVQMKVDAANLKCNLEGRILAHLKKSLWNNDMNKNLIQYSYWEKKMLFQNNTEEPYFLQSVY